MSSKSNGELIRGLGVWAAGSLVVGNIVGSGIFLVSSSMIRGVGTPEAVFLVWIFGGLLSLSGALAYAELAPCCRTPAATTFTCGRPTAGCGASSTAGQSFW